ncbi:RibD family protein [Methylomonas sp. AM2-LC]|uniref:RibD family protein n=1 Tax=Methylomonas sp. AM2-LC TaxID=3153301 RepID=UPI003264D4C6
MTINQQIENWLASRKTTFEFENRPFVTLSYAQSWDGSITTRTGETLALSGAESTRLTHQLRSLHDGILVGIGTVLTDDPQLTVREWTGANPQPIVLDSHLRMPPNARLCQHSDKNCWIFTSLNDDSDFGNQVEIITMEGDNEGRVNLQHALGLLWEKGIKMLMVEGGSQVITAFLKAQLADALVLTIAPTLIGGYKGVGNLGITSKQQLPKIRPLYSQMLEDDLIMWGDLQYQEPALS